MSGTEPRIAEIVAEVLAEHYAGEFDGLESCRLRCQPTGPNPCWFDFGEWAAHVGRVVAERLQAAEVGACGAAVGEAGTELPACDSGAQKAARELADFLDRNSPTFDAHRIVAVSPKLYAAIKRMPVRTRCDEDSGSYGTCGCPIRCNLDAGHDDEHRAGIGGAS